MHGKFLSAQPDGSAQWNRDVANAWEYFHLEKRQGGKITLKGAHGKYVSAQPDGSVQINRDAAPPTGWEEFTVEDRGNSVVCLKSCHGKYLSAQQDGTAQWNRDHAPPGGWEDIHFVHQSSPSQVSDAASRIQKHLNTGRSSTFASGENIRVSEHSLPEYNGIYTIQNNEINGKPWFKSNAPSSSKIRAGVGITLFSMGLPLLIIGSTSTGGDKLAMFVPGVVLFGIGVFVTVATAMRMGSTEGHSSVAGTGAAGGASTNLEVLSFNHRQPVRFSITNPPGANDAWVGLYPTSADDRDHGDRWHYLRDIDVSNATLPGQEHGPWSLRLFSDGGYNVQQRVDFEIRASTKKEVWMKEAEFGDQRLNGLIPDHRNNFTKKVTTSKIVAQHKAGNLTRFETDDTTYLVYDHDLQDEPDKKNQFWELK